MSGGTFGDDLDLTMERMTEKYNADLANGLGNLVSRIVKLSDQLQVTSDKNINQVTSHQSLVTKYIEDLSFDGALEYINGLVKDANKFIEDNKPWELAKNDEA
ncbi:MAG: Methionine-tRNA ligase, partial [Candidatus Moranbacteria bacterium GW2011_GWD2_38_7]